MNQIGQGRTADIFEYKEDKILKLYKKDFPEDAIKQEFLISNFAYSHYPARTIAPANMGFMVQIDAIAVID